MAPSRPIPLDVELKRGNTLRFEVTFTDENDDPVDYTADGRAVRVEFRPTLTSTTAVTPDQVTTQHADGILGLVVDYETSEGMRLGQWLGDVELTQNGERDSSQTFSFELVGDVTQPVED